MNFAVGMVVRPNAGHDAGRCHVIVKLTEHEAYIVDGKRRRLLSPKRKNLRHLSGTNIILPLSDDWTDKRIRHELWPYQYGGKPVE